MESTSPDNRNSAGVLVQHEDVQQHSSHTFKQGADSNATGSPHNHSCDTDNTGCA